ncbi:hypothetical protein OV079_16460 [Nannocystis pusilla]|uniref:Uncharacterized protein n=1 Tax=Nannocystis pusilla TaxID=889268 RepID=A0A9X3EN56_9BACT|nr:hypothetical protein [Nannocystis pusilla]MCY1007118.1 hypothetical protein [Nannocystis pusilla]
MSDQAAGKQPHRFGADATANSGRREQGVERDEQIEVEAEVAELVRRLSWSARRVADLLRKHAQALKPRHRTPRLGPDLAVHIYSVAGTAIHRRSLTPFLAHDSGSAQTLGSFLGPQLINVGDPLKVAKEIILNHFVSSTGTSPKLARSSNAAFKPECPFIL